jgi:hypothetical protein
LCHGLDIAEFIHWLAATWPGRVYSGTVLKVTGALYRRKKPQWAAQRTGQPVAFQANSVPVGTALANSSARVKDFGFNHLAPN